MGERREYRGSWDGLTVRTIANLMGCSTPTARTYLDSLAATLGGKHNVKKVNIGRYVISKYWEARELRELRKLSSGRHYSDPVDPVSVRMRVEELRKNLGR